MGLQTPESVPLVPHDHGQQHSVNGDAANTEKKTLSVQRTLLMTIALLVGTGTLITSRAIVNAGWYSLVILIVPGLAQIYASVLLGKCLVIVHQRYPSKTHIRNPYPLIAEKAFNPLTGTMVSIANNMCNFATAVALMLLTAQSMQSILLEAGLRMSYCYWVLIMSAILVPISWLGTPKDFWLVSAFGFIFVAVSLVLVVVLTCQKIDADGPSDIVNPSHFQPYMLSLGTMFYAYSGSTVFPTIQQDMEHPSKFTIVVIMSIGYMALCYVLVGWLGALAYGSDVDGNLLQSLAHGRMRNVAEACMAAHCLLAANMCLNPVAQDIENIECLKVPQHFNIKRCVIRTLLVGLMAFIQLSVPNFSGIVSLIGATLSQVLCLVIPCTLYLRLSVKTGPWPSNPLPVHVKFLCGCILFLGIIGGVVATYASIVNLFTGETFIPPCYVNITAASGFG